jgi:hypothetical protein
MPFFSIDVYRHAEVFAAIPVDALSLYIVVVGFG